MMAMNGISETKNNVVWIDQTLEKVDIQLKLPSEVYVYQKVCLKRWLLCEKI